MGNTEHAYDYEWLKEILNATNMTHSQFVVSEDYVEMIKDEVFQNLLQLGLIRIEKIAGLPVKAGQRVQG